MNLNVFVPKCMSFGEPALTRGRLVKMDEKLWCVYVVDGELGEFPDNETVSVNMWSDGLDSSDDSDVSVSIVEEGTVALRLKEAAVAKGAVILFDPMSFAACERLRYADPDQFQMLKWTISGEKDRNFRIREDAGKETPPTLSLYSNVFFHMYNTWKLIRACVNSIRRKEKFSVKTTNLLLALMVDVIIGIVILNWANNISPPLIERTFLVIDIIISNLQNLFKWLMGSPAGLKLNHAFNTMLGNFFLYHINLWGMFLEISRDALTIIIQIFRYLGMFGITFQAAIFADLLSLATFHIYCIYIYAARLYNLQLSGLVALWRLFLGRKHNPLRTIVDSCHYDNHQLFIGTLGFTILLFLLPTTLMYYTVFTLFRLIRLGLGGLLTWMQFIIRSFPLYLLLLWLVKAPKIAGYVNISLHPDFSIKSNVVVLNVDLGAPSLIQLITIYQSKVVPIPSKVNFTDLISKVFRGKVLNSD